MKRHLKNPSGILVIALSICFASQFSASAVTVNLAGVAINAIAPDLDGQEAVAGSLGGTAVFTRTDIKPAGTGIFNPFLALQANGTEEGYNSDGALKMDAKLQNFTRNLTVGELQIVSLTGFAGSFYQFILDANQNANDTDGKAVLSIDNLVLFTSPTVDLEETSFANLDGRPDTTQRFNLGANNVFIDAALGSTAGSGSADLFFHVPVTAFATALPSDYLYFYNKNGSVRESNDGFEEWSALTGPNHNVPEGGATLVFLGLGLVVLGWSRHFTGNA